MMSRTQNWCGVCLVPWGALGHTVVGEEGGEANCDSVLITSVVSRPFFGATVTSVDGEFCVKPADCFPVSGSLGWAMTEVSAEESVKVAGRCYAGGLVRGGLSSLCKEMGWWPSLLALLSSPAEVFVSTFVDDWDVQVIERQEGVLTGHLSRRVIGAPSFLAGYVKGATGVARFPKGSIAEQFEKLGVSGGEFVGDMRVGGVDLDVSVLFGGWQRFDRLVGDGVITSQVLAECFGCLSVVASPGLSGVAAGALSLGLGCRQSLFVEDKAVRSCDDVGVGGSVGEKTEEFVRKCTPGAFGKPVPANQVRGPNWERNRLEKEKKKQKNRDGVSVWES